MPCATMFIEDECFQPHTADATHAARTHEDRLSWTACPEIRQRVPSHQAERRSDWARYVYVNPSKVPMLGADVQISPAPAKRKTS